MVICRGYIIIKDWLLTSLSTMPILKSIQWQILYHNNSIIMVYTQWYWSLLFVIRVYRKNLTSLKNDVVSKRNISNDQKHTSSDKINFESTYTATYSHTLSYLFILLISMELSMDKSKYSLNIFKLFLYFYSFFLLFEQKWHLISIHIISPLMFDKYQEIKADIFIYRTIYWYIL